MNSHICQLNVVKTFLFLNPYLPEFSDPQNSEKVHRRAPTRKYPLGICPDLLELGLREKPGDESIEANMAGGSGRVFHFGFCLLWLLQTHTLSYGAQKLRMVNVVSFFVTVL